MRLSIRSLPGERRPDEPDTLFARGIWDGDPLPVVDLGDGMSAPDATLDLDLMRLGLGPAGQAGPNGCSPSAIASAR